MVDAGNALVLDGARPGRAGWDQAVEKAGIVAAGLAEGGIDAMALGAVDWELGWPTITALAAEHRLPILAANLVCGGERPFPATARFERGGLDVLVVGFAAGEVEGCTVEPPDAAPLPDLAGADLTIALLPHDAGAAVALDPVSRGIDLLIDGRSAGSLEEPDDLAGIWVLSAGSRGQRLGVAELRGRGPWVPGEALRSELVFLSDQVPEHPPTQALVEAGKARVAALETPVDLVLGDRIVTGSPFAGSATCAGCHAEETAQWAATPHAHAWASLEASGRELDRQCVRCHVTGWAADGGPAAPVEAAPFRDVQCEACHGPAAAHVADPTADVVRAPVAEVCTGCHDGVQDMGRFDPAAYLPRVVH